MADTLPNIEIPKESVEQHAMFQGFIEGVYL